MDFGVASSVNSRLQFGSFTKTPTALRFSRAGAALRGGLICIRQKGKPSTTGSAKMRPHSNETLSRNAARSV